MPQTPKSSNSNPIVLLVDDREENLLAFETCLQNLDCEIVTAKSGRKAIDYLKKNEVAAVVLDVQMPEMDGFEVAKIVRELEIAATTPILFVTALDRNDVHEELAYKLGAVDFVYKPVSAEALAGKVGFFITLYTRSKELERKNALLLDNAEAEKTTLLENALDAVVGVDENNRILFWNKHAATMFGWSKEEVLLQDMTTLIVPERHHTAHRMGMKRFIETGLQKIQNRRLEIPGIRKGGDEFLLELTVSSVKSNSGYRFYSFMRDISEAKKAETLLRESESKFRSLTEALPTIVFTTNAAGDTFHINDRWGKYTGKEFSPTAWQDAMHPDDLAIVHESWEKARANKSKWVVEYRLRRSDGVYRWQLGTSVPELSNDGEILRWIGAVVDIEDQKVVARTLEETNLSLESKVQERTKELTQAYRFVDSVLENIPNMIFVKDATDLKFVRFNKAGEELLGVSKTDLIGKNDYDFFPKSEADAFQAKDRSVLSGRTIVDIDEEPISTKNKGLRTLHTKKIPVYDSTGKPSFLIGISEDITERKIVERERLDLIEAQKVNRLKDEFLANLSHELRTPMNVIQGHADILADYAAKLPEDFRSSVEAIQRNAKAQTAIITDLLDVSSIITGKVSYHSSEISPAVLVGQVIEGFVPTAESKGVTLEHLSATCPTSVSADSTRLNQILWNLISNAIKFTGSGGRVTVKLGCTETQWSIEVEDTGAGIHPDFLPYVFDRFRQQDASSTRRYGGLGLGLSIVKNLTELHGGTVKAESQGMGRGSKFTVTLPLRHEPMDSEILTPKAQTPQPIVTSVGERRKPEAVKFDLKNVKILLVEDSDDNRVLVTRMLSKAGASVVDADGAAQARERLETFIPDLIVSDVGMPGENGMEFMKRLRESGATSVRSVPSIALTAYVREEEKQAALDAGFHAHVPKPVTAQALCRTIGELLKIPETQS